MSALGQKQTFALHQPTSALPWKADIPRFDEPLTHWPLSSERRAALSFAFPQLRLATLSPRRGSLWLLVRRSQPAIRTHFVCPCPTRVLITRYGKHKAWRRRIAFNFSPKLFRSSDLPSSFYCKLRANSVALIRKYGGAHGQGDVKIGAHSKNR